MAARTRRPEAARRDDGESVERFTQLLRLGTERESMSSSSGCMWPRPEPRASAKVRQQWREARVFQERAQRLFKEEMIPFVEWLLLETLQELIDERGEAATQAEVARRSGLSERVVSYWMVLMSELGIVDRGPDCDGRAWRVLLTQLGTHTVQVCHERLEAAGLTG
jgi:hypothetical protein